MKMSHLIIASIVTVWVLGRLDIFDQDVAALEHRQYCQDVEQYRWEVSRGFPENMRTGHPDWDNRYEDHC